MELSKLGLVFTDCIKEDSTIMLSQYDGEEEKICFNRYGLIDDDLDRRELCCFTFYPLSYEG